ncbi:MAG: hypothetical protein HYR84_16190 [Planctomycetes bacterium]|nr:hypothetical protein [Planctomycetota bacterium]
MKHLGRVFGFVTVLALLIAFAPADVLANKKKKDAKAKDTAPAASDADYKAIQKQKELVGKLVNIDAKMVTLRVEYSHYEPNPKYKAPTVTNPKAAGYNAAANQQYQMIRTYNDIMRQQQQAMLAKNPQEYQRAMQRIAQDMGRLQQEIWRLNQTMMKGAASGVKIDPNNQPFITVTNTKDFDLEVEEKVVYRKLILPFEYDDTGNPKTYTDKEKAELRGDDKTKPGYKAKLEEFAPGQEVKLYLTAPKKVEKDKDADKDNPMPPEVLRPTVNMVVMTKDNPNAAAITGAKDNPKKKKN